jgi:hypothetical protein
MIEVKGHVRGASETASALSQLPGLLGQAAEGAMTESLELVSRISRGEYLSGPFPHRLQPRTGRLRASMRRGDKDNIFQVQRRGTTIQGTLGTNVVYARIHEFGGIIKPVKGQYLAIPTQLAKTPTGIVKAEFNRPLRQIQGLFLMRSRRGNLGAYRRRGRRGILERLFSLVRRAVVFPRPFLHVALNRAKPEITQIFERRLNEPVKRLMETLRRFGGRSA